MKYWWVSQKGTFKHEFNGDYLWSPKEGKRGPLKAYDNMCRRYELGLKKRFQLQ